MRNRTKISFVVMMVVICCTASLAASSAPEGWGRSSTLLPDGRVLVAGGFDSRSAPTQDAFIASADGVATRLQARMNVARAGHTATMLPDGTVFIFGGIGTDGQVVSVAESFDPSAGVFSLLPDVLAVPRAFHTATLLTDGIVLLAGGVLAGGEFPDDVQLWDYRTQKALSFHALLSIPRESHTAALQADGTVRIRLGTDHFGKAVAIDEIYDPVTRRFHFADSGSDHAEANAESELRIAASIPDDGAAEVSIQSTIAIRFTRLLDVKTVNSDSFTLVGPDEAPVGATVTPAETGRLVFVTPAAPLQPGTNYALRIRGVADLDAHQLPPTSITFQTAGVPPDSSGPDWIPGPGWSTNTGTSKWQELPSLRAPAGMTALAGQVLKLSGWPLEHVTLEINGHKAHTDSTGRFLLRGLTAGHHVMWIDATTANHENAVYGVYEVGVTILPARTNVLNYTIWMTKLDTQHAVSIPSPTAGEVVITNPVLPGLELHLPPNTTITDRYGKTVHQVSITPVPLDKPPFPLPAGVQVPIYFTIQPGGAYIRVVSSPDGPKGARLFYPNGFNLPPGSPFEFWNYDADAKGWFIYGNGKVSADGHNIIPDPGVVIYEFTGAMVGSATVAPPIFPPVGSRSKSGDPVDLSTGQFVYAKTDLALPDVTPINFTRTYIANDSRSRAFGIGATDNYDIFMVGDSANHKYTYQELILPDGGRVRFDRLSFDFVTYVSTTTPGPWYGALLSWRTDNDTSLPGAWKVVRRDGTIMTFPDAGGFTNPFCQAVLQIRDRYGNTTRIDRNGGTCVITRITSPNGRYINVTSDAQQRITQLTDNSGRTVSYTYDAAGRLSTVTDVAGGVTTYTYDDQNRMRTITDARNIVYLTNQYDVSGRVIQQTQADGGTYLFSWNPTSNTTQTHSYGSADAGGGGGGGGSGGGAVSGVPIILPCWDSATGHYDQGAYNRYDPNCTEGYMPLVAQVDVTDPRGYVRRVKFGSTGYMTSDTHALGQPEEQTFTYSSYYDNLVQSVTDPLGRVTMVDYDSVGNPTVLTRLYGTPNAVTSYFFFNGPFAQLASMIDPLSHGSSFTYDQNGNLTMTTDPVGHSTNFAYNPAGRVTSVTDAVNHTLQFGYFGGDLSSMIDPLGNVSTQFTDSLGRVTSVTDALGNTTRLQYDVLNRVQQVTDPQGHVSSYTYDANGNPLSLTDAKGHVTSYTYDNMDRRATRVDPLLRQQSYTYDLNGNIATVTDRKGQVTSFTYDGLNRPIKTCFKQVVNGGVTSCESTVSYQYDMPNRRIIITDSLSGVITRTYDDLGRLISEVSPQTSVSYSYDAASRLTSKTVSSQAPFTYTYDNGNNLLSVTQGTRTVQLTYDSGGRLSTKTLPNGLTATYSYDGGSRLAGITYSKGQTTIGNLTYSYDALSRHVGVGGSLARTLLPSATVVPATYDATNQIATWNGTAFSYDANGSLINDGQNTYGWDGRGQLASISGAVSANFSYDALGRRIAKTIGPNALGFVYDGAGITQEVTGGNVTATIWSGSSNGFLERTDSSGTFDPLTDALGSVIALADSNGNLVTQYSYDPFGGTVATGAPSANSFQYIGRENDLTGLYYMHARYYSPALMRFISEDPLGFGGSDVNLHAYSLNTPTNLRDPNGTDPLDACWIGALGNAAWNYGRNLFGGRKTTIGDVLGWAAEGCETGVLFELTGVNWLLGRIIGGIIRVGIDIASPIVADILDSEIAAAADAAVGDATSASQDITDILQEHADAAYQRLQDEGFTEAQEEAMEANPNSLSRFQGERVDTFAKESAAADPRVAQAGVKITWRFESGPDFYNPTTGIAWDITTPGQWAQHVADYGTRWILIPLGY